jgi:hypothetical protein
MLIHIEAEDDELTNFHSEARSASNRQLARASKTGNNSRMISTKTAVAGWPGKLAALS